MKFWQDIPEALGIQYVQITGVRSERLIDTEVSKHPVVTIYKCNYKCKL
jgi:hypothetical protein